MVNKMREKIDQLIKGLHGDGFKRGEDWNGYKVFVPVYKKETYIGYPLVVLAKGDEVRVSTVDESLEYLAFSSTGNQEENEN